MACFNPVLGFLSVSTLIKWRVSSRSILFQSRAGFSECLDMGMAYDVGSQPSCFNPVLGFLSVSTIPLQQFR